MARPHAAALLAVLLLSAFSAAALSPQSAVVTVGGTVVTIADLEQRLKQVPSFQLAAFGADPATRKRGYVDRVLVPELLYAEEAKRLKLALSPVGQARVRDALRRTLENELAKESAAAQPVTEADIRAYYQQHQSRFGTPRRVRIWRILTDTPEAARAVLEQVRGVDGVSRWSQLSRDSSRDKATALRQGDLGFVRPDGTTDVPTVRVDPALFVAADAVKDGELVSEPVPEGNRFAAVWRRGSLAGETRTLEQATPEIRAALERERFESTRQALIDKLRREQLRDHDPRPIEELTTTAFGTAAQRARAEAPKVQLKPPLAPEKTDRGLR